MPEIIAYKAVWAIREEVYEDELSASAYYEPVATGDTASLQCSISGFDGLEVTYQWQVSADSETWADVGGAVGEVHEFTLAPSDIGTYYRAAVTGSSDGRSIGAVSDAVEITEVENA